MKYKLRKYQQECINKILWSLKLEGNSLAILPTGAGKSIIIAELARQLGQPLLILQPTKEILEQNYEKLLACVNGNQIGVYSASMDRKDINTYTLATIGSIYRKPELFAHFGMVLIDECHLVNPKKSSSMYTTFFNEINKIREKM